MLEHFDNDNYAGQCVNVVSALSPLFALGLLYDNEAVEIGVAIVMLALILVVSVSFFFKPKVCPKWIRDTINDVIASYLFVCLPALIFIFAGRDYWNFFYLGISIIVLDLLTCTLNKKIKAEAITNIETIQEIKEEAGDSAELVEALFRDKWKVVNKLCNIYYEKSDSTGSLKFVVRDIEAELEELRTRESIADILATTDRCLDGVVSQLRSECPFLKEQDVEFIGLIYSGLSVRAVCYLMGIRKPNFYQKKNRLIARISESDAPNREEFVERLSKFTK